MEYLKRKLLDEIRNLQQRREMIIIRGPRQAGKTTLMKIIEHGIKEHQKIFVNLDIPGMRREILENPVDFIKRHKGKNGRLFVFLDEAQRLKSGEPLKIIYDEFTDVKMFVSGSSSLEIKANVLPFLVGRAFLFNILTFDFGEFLAAKDRGLAKIFREKNESLKGFMEGKDEIASPSFNPDFLKLWKEYTLFGGYPEVIKAGTEDEKKLVLNSIKDLYIEKDLVSFFKIEETGKFEDLAKLMAFNVGSITSFSGFSSDIGINFNRIEEYTEILKTTYIIHSLRSFHRNLSTEIRKPPKIYFLDLGMRNALLNNFSGFDSRSDRGPIMENFVFREIISNFIDWETRFWRTTGKAEVDFVLSKGKEIIPVEAKLGMKIERGFHSFLRAYAPERAVVATFDHFGKKRIGKTRLFFVPAWYF